MMNDSRVDPRHIANGCPIPTVGAAYLDQPYVVKMRSGKWLCIMTLGTLGETVKGSRNFSAAAVSENQGRTWSSFVECNIHYALPYVAPSGRVYSISPLQFTWSEDEGETWSAPVRHGFFEDEHDAWSVCMPREHNGRVYIPFAQVGLKHPPRKTVVRLMVSDNLSTEHDPSRVTWQLLPEHEAGIRGPDWDQPEHRAEEPHLQVLSDGSLYMVFRTDQGYIGWTISRDEGCTWTPSEKLCYAHTGRTIKNPLACPSLWKCSNGKYLLFMHHHGKSFSGCHLRDAYSDRNPAWLCGGIEKDGVIHWSQPEVLLYLDDLSMDSGRISYPGFLEQDGEYYLFETDKVHARSHRIDPVLPERLWAQVEEPSRLLPEDGQPVKDGEEFTVPRFNEVMSNGPLYTGVSFHFQLLMPEIADGEIVLFSSLDADGVGVEMTLLPDGRLRFALASEQVRNVWESDSGLLVPGGTHSVTIIADSGPRILEFIIDGVFNDGGEVRQFGWGRFSPTLVHVGTARSFRVNTQCVEGLIGFSRPLPSSEALALHAGDKKTGV